MLGRSNKIGCFLALVAALALAIRPGLLHCPELTASIAAGAGAPSHHSTIISATAEDHCATHTGCSSQHAHHNEPVQQAPAPYDCMQVCRCASPVLSLVTTTAFLLLNDRHPTPAYGEPATPPPRA
jgi:hypothetical protein